MAHKRIILKTKFKDDNEKCAVCLDSMHEKTIAILPCKHYFHYTCFDEMTQTKLYTCPLCRYDLKPALKLLGIPIEADTPPAYTDTNDLYYLLYSVILNQDEIQELAHRAIMAEVAYDIDVADLHDVHEAYDVHDDVHQADQDDVHDDVHDDDVHDDDDDDDDVVDDAVDDVRLPTVRLPTVRLPTVRRLLFFLLF